MNLDLIKFYLDLFRISYKEYFSPREIVVVLQGNQQLFIAERQRIRGFTISFYYEPLIYFGSISDLLIIISMLFQRQIDYYSGSVFDEASEIIVQMKQIQELLLKV